VESAQLPSLDMDYYKCNVEPIFDRGCAMMGCHGTETGRLFKVYARGRLRHSEQVPNVCPGPNPVDLATGNGTVMCLGWTSHTRAEWQSNYDSARSFAVGITTANADTSELLAQPLNQAAGGKAHAGVHLFKDKTDQDYQTIKAWITGAALGTTCDSKGN
jgi:hypothetical protein